VTINRGSNSTVKTTTHQDIVYLHTTPAKGK